MYGRLMNLTYINCTLVEKNMRVLALRYIDGSIVIDLKTETNCIGAGVVPQESANLQSPKSFLIP